MELQSLKKYILFWLTPLPLVQFGTNLADPPPPTDPYVLSGCSLIGQAVDLTCPNFWTSFKRSWSSQAVVESFLNLRVVLNY